MFHTLLLVFWACLPLSGQPEKPEMPEHIRKLADAALAAPPELAADVLIRLAESKQISSKALKLDLLERAFALAGAARYPLRLRGTAPWTDNREWALGSGLDRGLSTLGLRVRVLKEMIPLDGARARLLFGDIRVPPVALECKATLVPYPSEHYDLIPGILANSFTAEERKKEAHVAWFSDQIRAANSVAHLEVMATQLLQDRWQKRQLETLLSAYASTMKQMEVDPRSSRFWLGFSLQQRMFELTRHLMKSDIPPLPLLDAYRSLLVRGMSGRRCVAEGQTDDSFETLRTTFNGALRNLVPQGVDSIREITAEESKPVATEAAGKAHDYWKTELSRPLLMGVKRLRFGTPEEQKVLQSVPQKKPGETNWLSIEQRLEPRWEEALRAFLVELERWEKDSNELEADHFHQLMMVYHPLLELTPSSDLRRMVLGSAISVLKTSSLQTTSPPDWYFQLWRLLAPYGGTDEERRARREEVRRSGDALMALYAELEEMLAR
ncbi:MAG: hypothetical protein JNL98_17905 [Bryobacterales bacterium]|nr:hypothetical protein [Bryobacterales bacterium]